MTSLLKTKQLYEATILAYRGNQLFFEENKGKMTIDTPFALASISKLYTYAIIFQLIDQGKLHYDTYLTSILPREVTECLPHGEQVTIRHLVDQTSGFPNYEMDRQPNGKVLMEEVLQQDRRVEWQEALNILEKLPIRSKLGGNKAYYADINAMLLGKMAEVVTEKTAEELLEEYICQPLNLSQTHWTTGDEALVPIYKGKDIVACQQYLASQSYQGGIIATNRELMRFIRTFFGGELFSASHISHPLFRPIQFRPLKYGSGLMQLRLGRIMSFFFRGADEIRGHSGITGSFAFYCPDKDIFVTGTLNQFSKHPYQMLFRVIAAGDKISPLDGH